MIEIDLHPAAAYSDDPEKLAANIDWFSTRCRQSAMGAVIQTDFCFHTKPAIGFRREPLPSNEERMRQTIGLVAKMFPDGEVAVLDAMADETGAPKTVRRNPNEL